MKKINWDFFWGYYFPVSTFSEKSQLLCIYLMAQFGEKNSNFLRNLRFEKISALVAPRPGLSFFVLWHSHTLFGKWVYHHGTMCRVHEICMTLTFGLNIKIIFSHGFESGKMSALFDIGRINFGIWVYHHETTCCVHSWP